MRSFVLAFLLGSVLVSASLARAHAQVPVGGLAGERVYLCTSGGLVGLPVIQATAAALDDGGTVVHVVLDSGGGMYMGLVNDDGQRYALDGGPLVWTFVLPADLGPVSVVREEQPVCGNGG